MTKKKKMFFLFSWRKEDTILIFGCGTSLGTKKKLCPLQLSEGMYPHAAVQIFIIVV